MTDLYYVYCIDDKNLQGITKTEAVGLQKLKYPIFLCSTCTNPLRRRWTQPIFSVLQLDWLGEFKSIVMHNLMNLFCNSQKSFHTSPTRIIGAVNHFSKSTIAFTKYFTASRNIFCKCYCWVWRMLDSLYYSSRKIPDWCENSFVDYRINYQKLCYLMRQITKDLNWP